MYNVKLQEMLESFQKAVNETPYVYFQPPESVKLSYPCFIYSHTDNYTIHSNGKPYLYYDEYTITYITKKTDPMIVKSMLQLPRMAYDRHFTADNLHHYVFKVTSHFKMENDVVDLSEEASRFLGGTND